MAAKKNSKSATTQLLQGQDDSFWEAINVFPKLMQSPYKDFKAQALSSLRKCGKADLKLLCERLMIAIPENATPEQLSANLLAADNSNSILFLAEFIRGKGAAIQAAYASHFSVTIRRKHSAQLHELGNRDVGGLKQFSRLILLYQDSPQTMNTIFVRKLWRSKKTTSEFLSPVTLDAAFIDKLGKSTSSLAEAMADAFAGYELEYFTTAQIDGWQVLLLKREYAPITRPDYRDTQKTLHGFGWIMFGVEVGKRRIILKGGGKKALPIVKTWFGLQLEVELADAEAEIVTNYDPLAVEAAFLGDEDTSSSIKISAVYFCRTMAPQHSPITIEPFFPGYDISRDLQFAREKGLLRMRSLSDMKWFRVRHGTKEALIEVTVDLGGAVTLRVNNVELSELEVDELSKAFEKRFSIPLNRRIDPQKLSLGTVDVYNSLLESDRKEGLAGYQLRALDGLLSLKIISVRPESIVACPKQPFICKLGGQPVIDEDLSECPECQSRLEATSVDFLDQNDVAIRKFMRKQLRDASGWQLSNDAVQFEGKDFYPLYDPTRPDHIVRVYFAKRVGERLLLSLDRSLQPVLVVHTGGDVEHAHLDASGVGHISLARAIAAQVDDAEKDHFREDVSQVQMALIRRQEERVFRRAEESRMRIGNPPSDYTGNDYQVDVFNVMRSIFPYTEYWAGTNRPDGFCCLVSFENANLREPQKHNLSYDAKFNKDGLGYNLGASEKRKEWDYVAALARQPELSTQGNELNGHAIIANILIESQMVDMAKFLRREHRIGKKHSNVKVVFMLDSFLTTLYDSVRMNEEKFRQRWNWLSYRVSYVLKRENAEDYVYLDAQSATDVINWVLNQREVDTPPDQGRLQDGMNEIMSD